MYLDYRRLLEEQLMRESGPSCVCGRRAWSREPVRDSAHRRFKCLSCLRVLEVSAERFRSRVAQESEGAPRQPQP
jgi:hypothetical protein